MIFWLKNRAKEYWGDRKETDVSERSTEPRELCPELDVLVHRLSRKTGEISGKAKSNGYDRSDATNL